MQIEEEILPGKLKLKLKGRLDTATAPELDRALQEKLKENVMDLVIDFTELEYVSSAGLRVILTAQKKMEAREGSMRIRGANEGIKQVFKITGFSQFLTVEDGEMQG